MIILFLLDCPLSYVDAELLGFPSSLTAGSCTLTGLLTTLLALHFVHLLVLAKLGDRVQQLATIFALVLLCARYLVWHFLFTSFLLRAIVEQISRRANHYPRKNDQWSGALLRYSQPQQIELSGERVNEDFLLASETHLISRREPPPRFNVFMTPE